MKKLMRILGMIVLSVIMTVAMVACGGRTPATSDSGTTDSVTDSTTDSTTDTPSYTADPYGETDLAYDFTAGTKKTKAYWNFTYTDTALSVTARVNDLTPIKNTDISNTDAICLYVGTVANSDDYVVGQTLKIFITSDGVVFANKASSTTAFEGELTGITAEAGEWSRTGHMLDGYKVEFSVPYSAMGLEAADAQNKLSILPVVIDKFIKALEPVQGIPADYNCKIESQKTFISLTGNNTFEVNPFGQNGTFGNTGSLVSMDNWDLTMDYYEGLGSELYDQRKAVLREPRDKVNNELYFYKVNNPVMYAESDFQLKSVINNEKYGKFGIAVVYNGIGYFFYVDATTPENNGVCYPSSVTGKNVGIVEIEGNNPKWGTEKSYYVNYNANAPIKLGVYREEESFRFFADGVEICTKSNPSLSSECKINMAVWSYNIALELTNFRATDDQNDPMIKNNRFEMTEVDYLFTGDSYVDLAFWNGFETDVAALAGSKVNIGVGGTQVRDWSNRIQADTKLYDAKNIIMHIGVNDIDDAHNSAQQFADNFLKYIENYRNYDSDVHFYWITINPNVMFAQNNDIYVEANTLIKTAAETIEYLDVIDFYSDTTEIDGVKLADGLHLSKLGYAEWTKAIHNAFGIDTKEGNVLGSNAGYVMSAGWDATTDGGDTPYVVNTGIQEQAIWYKSEPIANFYFEAKITKKDAYNNDNWTKFGIMAKTDKAEVYYYVDANVNNTNSVGLVTRDCYSGKTTDWYWGSSITKSIEGLVYTGDQYVTLGLLKYGHTFYAYVNGNLAFKEGFADTDGVAQTGIMSFNLGVIAKEYRYVSDDAQLKEIAGGDIQQIGTELTAMQGASLTLEGFNASAAWKEESGLIVGNMNGEDFAYSNINSENFYFETNFTLTRVNNSDAWPKAGIAIRGASGSTLIFYVDAVSVNGAIKGDRFYGVTQRPVGGEWVWGNNTANNARFNQLAEVASAPYINGKFVRLAVVKYNGVYYFAVNNVVQFINSDYFDTTGLATPGMGGFNLGMTVKSAVATVDDAEILANLKAMNVANDKLLVDGDISDWEADATLSAHYYGATATDASGKYFKFYAAKVNGGIMVAGKAITSNSTAIRNHGGDGDWYLNTNVEWTYACETAGARQGKHASMLRDAQSAKSFIFKCKTLENGLYEVTFEMYLSYADMPYSEGDNVEVLLAFRNEDNVNGLTEGNTGVWWCGKYHPYNAVVAPFTITENGIEWKEGFEVAGA